MFLIVLMVSVVSGFVASKSPVATAQVHSCSDGPKIVDDATLTLVPIFRGLSWPVSMAFLGNADILIAQRADGTIHRIINGNELSDPLLDVEVANGGERGLLGLAIAKNESSESTYVFIFYTKSGGGKDGDDVRRVNGELTPWITPYGSVLERYELVDDKLINPKLLLYVNSTPAPTGDIGVMHHVGGKITVGPDNNVYVITGDSVNQKTNAQNYVNGSLPNGTGGILRVTQDGRPVVGSQLGNQAPWVYYYGYGVRNGFGMDFDPLSGKLWTTEAGDLANDEINMVEPGFNGGWVKIQGPARHLPATEHVNSLLSSQDYLDESISDLESPDGKGKYQDPAFTWNITVTPTAIKFYNSDMLGKQYENDMFVARYGGGSANQSSLYRFDLNMNRSGLLLNGSLMDKVADTWPQDEELVFAICLGAITDMQVGPDGHLYLLEHFSGSKPVSSGTIYRLEKIGLE